MIKIPVNTKNVPEVNVWITSDTHFSHKNICRGTTNWRTQDGEIPISQTRDFTTIEKMNATIVNNINENVGQDDIFIHLGTQEGLGLGFYESLYCGTPILTIDWVPNTELIQHNKNGWISSWKSSLICFT